MRVGIYLSIRNKASRLPGKSLLPLAGQPLIVFMIERIKGICGSENVVVCTSDHPDDAILAQEAETCGVQVFCGSQDDKLRRYLGAAEHYSHDAMLIIDGDDPFISISHAKQTLEALQDENTDMVLFDNLPVGAMAFGIKTRVLRKSVAENPERDTEVWAPFLRQVAGLREVTLHEKNAELTQPSARMTVDYPEDYDFCCRVLAGLRPLGQDPTFENIMALLQARPDLVAINAHKATAYEQHLNATH